MKRIFVLGAPDPEMAEIERVLKDRGEVVRYAMDKQQRVRADAAYTATSLDGPCPPGAQLVFVECSVLGLPAGEVVDHHREGDPGYGKPPSDYLYASSLGQVLQMLGVEPTMQQRIIAAADHCPTQAYRNECPGVTPTALAEWRTASRAERRGVTREEMEKAILTARTLLESAERVPFAGQQIAWVADRQGEIPEASARFGIPFMYAEPMRDGRTKLGIMGAEPPVIAEWMAQCGLQQVYGDPARGYAGGYC